MLLTLVFSRWLFGVAQSGDGTSAMKPEKQLFAYSILYLFLMFAALAVDRMVLA
jgi:protoheme IX farnesyltransferase